MPKRRALLLLGLILAMYPVSYLVVSRDGFYDPGPIGTCQGPGNRVIFISKFGYTWHPFHEFCTLGNFRSAPVPAFFSAFYRPLLVLDRQWWHTEMKAESGDYRVKPVFSIAGKTGTARIAASGK